MTLSSIFLKSATLFALWAASASAFPHVVLEEPAALAGQSYKAALRISHGCAGSPTTAVRVLIPAGLRGAKPMPKPGWTVTLRREKLASPYEQHGRQVSEDVVEIHWTAASRASWLDDAHVDEFVLRGTLPAQAGPMWFKVLQTCEQGSLDWSQLPAGGTSTQGLKSPAARLDILPAEPEAHHAH